MLCESSIPNTAMIFQSKESIKNMKIVKPLAVEVEGRYNTHYLSSSLDNSAGTGRIILKNLRLSSLKFLIHNTLLPVLFLGSSLRK